MSNYNLDTLKNILKKSNFLTDRWTDIRFQEKSGIAEFVVVSDENIRIQGATPGELSLIIHLRKDIHLLLEVFDAIASEKNSSEDFRQSKEFKYLRMRNQLVRPGIWKSYIEGRDHMSGDSMIGIESNGKVRWDIYITPLSEIDQDFICEARNQLGTVIKLFEENKLFH